jgi:glutathione S-transferase
MTSITLYDTPGSPCARRVRATLIEKGLPFSRVILDLARMENKAPWYLAINPNGQVPAIRIGDRTLYESNVITEYLDAIYPRPRLYPPDPVLYAEVKQWQTFEQVLSKHYGLLQYARMLGPLSRIGYSFNAFMTQAQRHTQEPALLQWEARVWRGEVLTPEQEQQYEATLYQRLDVLEEALDGRRYLVGEHFSQADISVYPRIAMYPYLRLQIDPERYPNVAEWMRRLRKRPAFTRSATLPDRLMASGTIPQLIAWADPKQDRQTRNPLRAAALRASRRLLSGDIMRAQAQLDRVSQSLSRLRAPLRRTQTPAPVETGPRHTPHTSAASWSVHACPFNSESRVVLAVLLATDTAFDWHPLRTPLGEEHRAQHRGLAPLPEVPLVLNGGTPVTGWPYVLARIAESRGASPLYPAAAYDRAQVQIGCMGDTVVNFKYKRPLYWQRIVAPWLHSRFSGLHAYQASLQANTVDPTTLEFCTQAWTGTLISTTQADACVELLDRRTRLLASALSRQAWFCGSALSLGDVAEWVRLDESLELGLRLDPNDPDHARVLAWKQRIDAMHFVKPWRALLRQATHSAPPDTGPVRIEAAAAP